MAHKPTAPDVTWQWKVFPILTNIGWMLIMLSFIIGAFVLASTATSYFGANAKVTRDAAAAGSALLGQLRLLNSTGRWLEPLTFLGVASFMTGIALEFSTIPRLLHNRGQVMSACFPLIVEKGQ